MEDSPYSVAVDYRCFDPGIGMGRIAWRMQVEINQLAKVALTACLHQVRADEA
jgi:hypothetical protein